MRRARLLCLPLIAAAGIIGYASSAHAQLQEAFIVLDQTGSMTQVSSSGCGADRWDDAINGAVEWTEFDSGDLAIQRTYSIWTFKNDSDTGQQGLKKIYPETEANGGVGPCQSGTIGAGEGCQMPAGAVQAAVAYQNLLTMLHTTVRTNFRAVPGPNTPLAQSLCNAITNVNTAAGFSDRMIIFESDSGENASNLLSACRGTVEEANTVTTFNKSVVDWGFTGGSWQNRIVRRWIHLPNAEDPAANTPLAINEPTPPQWAFRVDISYAITTSPMPSCPALPASMMAAGTSALRLAPGTKPALEGGGTIPAAAFLRTSALATTTSTASATPSALPPPGSTDIPLQELAFWQSLGKSTPKSSFRQFVLDTSVVYGTFHARQGDVDDSNCVDMADYNILKQRDVWHHRAVRPLEIAIRADLNRDGWANELDRDILIANWGSGCINPPGPRPFPLGTCGDGTKNATETDVDCGGLGCSDCATGKVCLIAADCISGICTDGVCTQGTNVVATTVVTNDWGGGYCANINVVNQAAKATKNWSVRIDTNQSSVYQIWNGTRSGNTGTVTMAPNAAWNKVIPSNGSTNSVGFCANRTVSGSGTLPIVVSATGVY